MNKRSKLFFLLASVCLFLLIILRLCWGEIIISITDLFQVLFQQIKQDDIRYIVLFELRFPVVISAILGGAALSISGLQMQALFRNPLADPFILGISSANALSTLVFLLLAGQWRWIAYFGAWGNIFFSAVSTGLILSCILLFYHKTRQTVSLLLIGVMLGFAITSVTSILIYLAPPLERNKYLLWLFGSFARVTSNEVPYFIGFITFGFVLAFLISYPLNVILLGHEYAISSGVSVGKLQFLILINTFLLTGIVTAFCGPIGFVGLAVPHMAKKFLATLDHRILVPACALLGAILMLAGEIIASLPCFNITLPISSITALFGAPFMIYLLGKQKYV